MTVDEHMCIRYHLMDVRDDLQDLLRRDPHTPEWVGKLEACLAILNRRHIRGALTSATEKETA